MKEFKTILKSEEIFEKDLEKFKKKIEKDLNEFKSRKLEENRKIIEKLKEDYKDKLLKEQNILEKEKNFQIETIKEDVKKFEETFNVKNFLKKLDYNIF